MYSPPTVAAVLFLLLAYLCYRLLSTYTRLRHVPGPFWARLTNLPRIAWVRSRRAHEIHTDLHNDHGDCVRFGPNMVSIADPAVIPIIYPMRPGFPKVCAGTSACRQVPSKRSSLADTGCHEEQLLQSPHALFKVGICIASRLQHQRRSFA